MSRQDDASRAAAFVDLFRAHPPRALIGNLTTRVDLLEAAGRVLPVTLNDRDEAGNCYLCRPSTAYVDYGLAELRNFAARPALKAALAAMIRAARPLVAASGLDHQVQLNNWLLSTNPLAPLDRPTAAALRDAAAARFPGRAVLIRSLNTVSDGASLAALAAEGFRLIPARRVWLLRPGTAETKSAAEDRRKLAATGHVPVADAAFTDADYHRAAGLYDALYLRKYTPLNPAYSAAYLAGMHRRGLITLEGLRQPGGPLVAVTGCFRQAGVLTQPIVGYDTARPMAEGLYRMVMLMARRRATAEGLVFNVSAGAGDFKRRRGAVPAIEYTAAWLGALPARQRRAARALEAVLARVGVAVMERFDL